MDKAIYLGKIKDGVYYKEVNWNKAVLWKDREISLHRKVVEGWFTTNWITDVVFHDRIKKMTWTAPLKKIKKHWKLKQVGQEAQYYFPIEILNVKKEDET